MIRRYSFRKVQTYDLELILTWRKTPDVMEWWGTDELLCAQDLKDDRVQRWIVSFEGCPFAYIQDYTVHGWKDHHFYDFPSNSRGIDQFIGVAEMIGVGHGSAFIAAHVATLFNQGVPVVGTDPDPDNLRAIAAYKKAGFEAYAAAKNTRWGPILPMRIKA